MRTANIATGAFLIVVSLLAVFVVIPAQTSDNRFAGLSPAFLPTATALAIAFLSLIVVVTSVLRKSAGDLWDEQASPINAKEVVFFAAMAGFLLVGIVCTGLFGTLAGGSLLVGGFMLFLGERRPLVILLTCCASVGGVYLFANSLRLPLP